MTKSVKEVVLDMLDLPRNDHLSQRVPEILLRMLESERKQYVKAKGVRMKLTDYVIMKLASPLRHDDEVTPTSPLKKESA